VPQLDHAAPQFVLGFQRRIDLLALPVPSLHGEVQLRRLQACDLEVRAQPASLECAQTLLEPAPGTREDRHVVGQDGALVEAEITGVRQNPISRYRAYEYHLVHLGSEFSSDGRARAVAYSKAQVGQGFGFLDMFGASLYLLFGWPVRLMRRDPEICSGLVVRALQAGGLVPQLDPLLTLPADIAKLYDVRP